MNIQDRKKYFKPFSFIYKKFLSSNVLYSEKVKYWLGYNKSGAQQPSTRKKYTR
jgi:hypothetical protein